MKKMTGKKIIEYEGISIYVDYKKPKTSRGKKRMWMSIRQKEPKPWKIGTTLSYHKAIDILFKE